jgi:group II intron reverse transcriptase/maturase
MRGCHNALAAVAKFIDSGMRHVLEVDIENFFGSLNHEWLEKFLSLRIGDKRILNLIKAWLKAGVMENDKPIATEEGTVQGGSISPLLANIYLHYVLDLWFEKKIRRRLKGKAELVRYADDFVFTCEHQEDMEELNILLKFRLEQFGLKIAEKKTHKSDLNNKDRERENQRRHIDFLGMTLFMAKTKSGKGEKIVFKTEKKRFGRAKMKMKEKIWKLMHFPLKWQAKIINSILRGHFNYYGLPGNIERLVVFRYETIKIWKKALLRRGQKDNTTWEVMNENLIKFPLIFPKLKINYGALNSYVLSGKRY